MFDYYKNKMVSVEVPKDMEYVAKLLKNFQFYNLVVETEEEKEILKLLDFYEDANNPNILFNYIDKICCQLIHTKETKYV